MFIVLFLYLFLLYSFSFFIKYKNVPIIHLPLVAFAILKTTLDYRVCSVAYVECKLRDIKRDESIVNKFLDPIVDLRYTNHVYPLFILGYLLLFISYINYLKYYLR